MNKSIGINEQSLLEYFKSITQSPLNVILFLIDISLVIFLAVKFFQIVKGTRVWQLLKGIIVLIIATIISGILSLKILNYILTSIMTYGVILIIVIFQPELRRALEQLGTNKISKFFGIDKDIIARTKESIYKIVIAASELSKSKTGALIAIERDIKLKDIIDTGVQLNAEISPQLLVNIFNPRTPLHDGAVIISENKIMAAACMLPLSDDKNISKGLGTRHRSAIGMSKESDSIVVVVSEETGKISVAKDGTLIADVKEEVLKQILIKNIITKKYGEEENNINNDKKLFFKKNSVKVAENNKKRRFAMRNIKLTIEYDGKKFNGWQKQPEKLNIQGEIENAIKEITGETVELYASGRTDAGVHSLGQIANFKTESNIKISKIPIALNSKLKKSIVIKSAEEVPESFHARYNAKGKKYRYIINNSLTGSAIYRDLEYHMPIKLDIEKMKQAVKYFEGEHDFKAFKSSGTSSKSSVRNIYKAEIIEKDERISIELTGSGFLYNMVRIISGTIVDVGLGKISPEEIPNIIESKDRTKAGKTLPAHGLYLVEVYY